METQTPAVTVLSALVDHLEAIGHRDMPEVHQARAFLTSLNPPEPEAPKPEPKTEHPKTEHPKAEHHTGKAK